MSTLNALVHISAPSTRQRDDRYSAQALAYGNFVPTTRHDITKGTDQMHVPATLNHHTFNTVQYISCKSQRSDAGLAMRTRNSTFGTPRRYSSKNHSLEAPDTVPMSSAVFMANADVEVTETQRMFDTQLAAAGIESQISDLFSDDNGPMPSTELFPPSKRRREEDEQSSESSKRNRTSVDQLSTKSSNDNSLQSLSTQTSSQDRRDSQSAEVPSPVERPRTDQLDGRDTTPVRRDHHTRIEAHNDDSPSAAMEREIAAYKLLRGKRPELFREPLHSVEQLEEIVSSLLPESYGLSKSDDSVKEDDVDVADGTGLPHEKLDPSSLVNIAKGVENILNTHEETDLSHITGEAIEHDTIVVMEEDAIYFLDKHPQDPERTIETRDFAPNLLSSTHPAQVDDRFSTSLGVPKPTKLPPPKKRTSLLRKPPIASLTGKVLDDHVSPEAQCVQHVSRFPRHFFPKPKPESAQLAQEGANHAPTSMAKPLDTVMAERHMLYRRKMHRELSPIERGFWSVNVSSWSSELQLDFLVDLRTQIEDRVLTELSWVDIHHDTLGTPSTVELYCGVAELGEAWLLLMVLSERRIANQDLHWIGWDGQPAITMPSRNAAKEPS